jgi:hypothetical protein
VPEEGAAYIMKELNGNLGTSILKDIDKFALQCANHLERMNIN